MGWGGRQEGRGVSDWWRHSSCLGRHKTRAGCGDVCTTGPVSENPELALRVAKEVDLIITRTV